MSPYSVILLGGSGLVGGECLKKLCLDDNCHRITLLLRRPIPSEQLHPKIESHIINFDDIDSYREKISADKVICALGTTIKKAGNKESFYKVDYSYPYKIAQIALNNGANHFILVSSKGANPNSPFFYLKVKGELEQAISKVGYQKVTIFRPSLLMGKRADFRFGEELGKWLTQRFSFLLPKNIKPTPVDLLVNMIIQQTNTSHDGSRIIESAEMIV
ncbi:MAG: NAD(P)H-binding protein [Desulfobacterales bacterium]|nr:NAD(P)H-binding protein [Desulfobacterales bacterium]